MAKGAVWMVLFRLAERSIGLISTLFLARLLVPADFGLVAMAMSIVAALETLTAFSFDLALIQNARAERRHYDTAWTFNVVFGLATALILLALAGPVAAFYAEERVENIIRWLALYAAIQGFANIGIVAFQKDLELHKEFRLGITRKLIAFTVTIALAFSLRSYWALVAGTIVSALAAVVLSYAMHPYRPRLSLAARNELFHFSKWMLVNNVLTFLSHRSTDLVVGRYAGAPALGTYNIAYEVSNLPTTELVFPIGRAVFPGYAKMAGSMETLRQGFLDVLSVILLFTVPAGLGIMLLAEPLVYVLLGEKWQDAIPLVQILSVFGVLRASASNIGSIYLALGMPQLIAYLALIFLAVMAVGFWLWVPDHGAIGAAFSVLLAVSVQVPLNFAVILRKTRLALSSVLNVMWRPLAAGLAMAAALSIAMTREVVLGLPNIVQLAILVPCGAIVYCTSIMVLWMMAGRPLGGEAHLIPVARAMFSRVSGRIKRA